MSSVGGFCKIWLGSPGAFLRLGVFECAENPRAPKTARATKASHDLMCGEQSRGWVTPGPPWRGPGIPKGIQFRKIRISEEED
jgi:hypothetical protein